MKLTIVASGDFFSNYGGGQVYVRNLVDELIRQKERLELILSIISFSPAFTITPTAKDYQGVALYEISPTGNISSLLEEIKPDIVHAHGEKTKVASTCKSLGIRCIVTVHHGGLVCPEGSLLNTDNKICSIPADYRHCIKCYLRHTPTGLFWYPLLRHYNQQKYIHIGERLNQLPFIPFLSPIGKTGMIVNQKLNEWQKLCKDTTHFIAPSTAVAEALIRNNCPKEKISVIPHGIPNTHIPLSDIKSQPSNIIHFYYAGRINYVKGIHVMLEAFSEIDNAHIRLHLIGGSGNNAERRYMKRLQRKYCSDGRIIWHGKVAYTQLPETTKDYHCLIHPTICLEVFGLDIAEALQHNKFVIATHCGGAEMQIRDEKDGILVPPNNVDFLRKAVIRYIDSPHKSECNVEKISSHINKLFTLYTKLLSNN